MNFSGRLVGNLGYDFVRYTEELKEENPGEIGIGTIQLMRIKRRERNWRKKSCGPDPKSHEVKKQVLEAEMGMQDVVVACVGGGFNSIGMFAEFIAEDEARRAMEIMLSKEATQA